MKSKDERWAQYHVLSFSWWTDEELERFLNKNTKSLTTLRSIINQWKDDSGCQGATFVFEDRRVKRPLTNAQIEFLARYLWETAICAALDMDPNIAPGPLNSIRNALLVARDGHEGEPAGGVEPPASGVRNQRSTD